MKIFQTSLLPLVAGVHLSAAGPAGEPVSGVYFSKRIESSPRFIAKGMAWWDDRMVIVNREPAALYVFTPGTSSNF